MTINNEDKSLFFRMREINKMEKKIHRFINDKPIILN